MELKQFLLKENNRINFYGQRMFGYIFIINKTLLNRFVPSGSLC